jgi:hypothetical protein
VQAMRGSIAPSMVERRELIEPRERASGWDGQEPRDFPIGCLSFAYLGRAQERRMALWGGLIGPYSDGRMDGLL